jgi:hypothetical protein
LRCDRPLKHHETHSLGIALSYRERDGPGAFAMTSPKEYRQFAIECGKQAAATKDEKLRAILLETARVWMQAAFRAERSYVLTDDDSHSSHKESARP